MKARGLKATLAFVIAMAGLTACGTGGDPASDTGAIPVRVLATTPSMNTGLPLAMVALGTADGAGLDMKYEAVGAASSTVIAGVMSGEADFGVLALAPAIEAIHTGAPIEIIAGTAEVASLMVVSNDVAERYGNKSVDERLRGLEGLTVGTGPVGSTNYNILRAELSRVGLDPDKDVTIIGMSEPTALVSGLKQGQFDAGFYGAGALEQNLADGDGAVYLTGKDLPTIQDMIGIGVIGRSDYIAKNADSVERLRAALAAATEQITADPVNAGEKLHTKFFAETSPAAWAITWELGQSVMVADTKISQDAYEKNLTLLAAGGSSVDVPFDEAVAEIARKDSE
ncbi:ABC transporter substrate-binding protein [Rhodococcus sp. USK10]|uniref:ABC transporter substrate-binding protein n=1 Tax=Rhodococcus sp. USK10 TaxID=2789739 RepID=UPI001C5E786C|nr:ABC transporter substrate-binding protein [Rhodococcus sp. USK10]QYB07333.1 ABC transporter substrate-binding protein [Rhodococcus sp. USK10]